MNTLNIIWLYVNFPIAFLLYKKPFIKAFTRLLDGEEFSFKKLILFFSHDLEIVLDSIEGISCWNAYENLRLLIAELNRMADNGKVLLYSCENPF